MAAKRLTFDFEIKKKTGKNITIAGLSNANTVDRMKERIDPKGWLLENYNKNPVYLFDHGHDPAFGFLPIGKSTKHTPTDDGLYTEGQISSSPTEKISAVRDLVEEGILKTFSVGFDPKADTKDGDTLVITKAELIEQSIVPIPMNQDSVFSVMQKRLGKAACPSARLWFENWAKKAKLIEKRAVAAALIHQTIVDRRLNLGEVAEAIAKKAAVKERLVREMMEGDQPFPSHVLGAASAILKIDGKILAEAAKLKDVALLERARTPSEEVKDMKKKAKKKDASPAAKKGPEFICTQITVPKAAIDEAEGAAAFVEQHGYAADKMSETDDAWIFEQAPAEGLNMDAAQMFDLGDGVMAQVAPKGEGKAADDMADGKEDEGGEDGKTDAASEEDQKKPGAEGAEDDGKEKGDEEEKDEKAAADTTPPPDQNPLIELQKQQITMLGALVEEMKKVTAKLDELVQMESAEPADDAAGDDQTPPPAKDGDDEESKALVLQIREAHGTVKTGLKRLGV